MNVGKYVYYFKSFIVRGKQLSNEYKTTFSNIYPIYSFLIEYHKKGPNPGSET